MVNSPREPLSKFCSVVSLILYIIIAILLIIGAVAAIIESINSLVDSFVNIFNNDSYILITEALQSILLIIVIVTLIDMVRSYIKYGRILAYPILVAGITSMVRRLLVSETTYTDMIGIAVVIFVLTIAMLLLGSKDFKVTQLLKKRKKDKENGAILENTEPVEEND